jgi:hypothetical protein
MFIGNMERNWGEIQQNMMRMEVILAIPSGNLT